MYPVIMKGIVASMELKSKDGQKYWLLKFLPTDEVPKGAEGHNLRQGDSIESPYFSLPFDTFKSPPRAGDECELHALVYYSKRKAWSERERKDLVFRNWRIDILQVTTGEGKYPVNRAA